jgi:hypothetical protein
MRTILQHNLNQLHLYCRLMRLGLGKVVSRKIAVIVSLAVKTLIYT